MSWKQNSQLHYPFLYASLRCRGGWFLASTSQCLRPFSSSSRNTAHCTWSWVLEWTPRPVRACYPRQRLPGASLPPASVGTCPAERDRQPQSGCVDTLACGDLQRTYTSDLLWLGPCARGAHKLPPALRGVGEAEVISYWRCTEKSYCLGGVPGAHPSSMRLHLTHVGSAEETEAENKLPCMVHTSVVHTGQ